MSQRPAFPTTFVSLSKIMLAIFILLNTLSTRDIVRERSVLAALQQTFGQHSPGFAPAPPPEDARITRAREQLAALRTVLISNEFRFTEESTGLTVTIPRAAIFVDNENRIQAHIVSSITALAKELRTDDCEVQISTHTDIPSEAKGDPVESWRTTARDAASLYRLFVDAGVDPRRLYARGMGASDPLLANDSPEHRAFNRRIVLSIQPKPL